MKDVFRQPGVVTSIPMKQCSVWPTGRLWPNGNFTMGTTRSVEPSGEGPWGPVESGLPDWFLCPDAERSEAPLNSSNVLISREAPKRARKGLSGITPYGQQMLRSAAYLVERDYGKEDLCFATLTVPTLPADARRKLQASWGKLLNRLVEFVRRKLEEAGRAPKVFGCVEVQSQRLQTYREGYLHLHVVWPSHSNQAGRVWAVTWAELRTWWKAAVERFSGQDLSVYPRVQTSPIELSVEKYMGKYLSKGGGLIEEFIALEGEDSCPTAWWFCSQAMKDYIEEESVEGEALGVVLDAIVFTAFEESSLDAFEWLRAVDMEVAGLKKTVGWCGRLTREAADDVRAMFA